VRKIVRRGLHERVVEEVGKSIVGGDFAPGDPLPSEASLCERLGVCRTALREALRVLAAKGLVDAKPKIGTSVTPRDRWNFLDADVLSWRLGGAQSEHALAELYELRRLIEPIAASLAASNASHSDIESMRTAFNEMQAAGDDGELFAEPDLRFHRAIIAASGNQMFSSLAHVISAALSVNFNFVRNAPRGHIQSIATHGKVLDAISARNPDAARRAMQAVIEMSQQDAREAIQRACDSPRSL